MFNKLTGVREGEQVALSDGRLIPLSEIGRYVPEGLVICGRHEWPTLDMPLFDVLELALFVHPTRSFAPSLRSLLGAYGLSFAAKSVERAQSLQRVYHELLAGFPLSDRTRDILTFMTSRRWAWGEALCDFFHIPASERLPRLKTEKQLAVWEDLPKWSFGAPTKSASLLPVETTTDAESVLVRLSATALGNPEPRPQQKNMAQRVLHALLHGTPEKITMTALQAPTGTGKTLAYVAGALAFRQDQNEQVWISTFTKNLQKQIAKTFSDIDERNQLAVRKGRENYLCLLNFERESVTAGHYGLGFIARWIQETSDGDFVSGDFPKWLPDWLGLGDSLKLTDRRGECLFAGCPHFRRCFIERSISESVEAPIVLANHALTLFAGRNSSAETGSLLPQRLIFDEAHHLFDAADSAYALYLSGRELREFATWIGFSERRGLLPRLDRLLAEYPNKMVQECTALLREMATDFPTEGWLRRLRSSEKTSNTSEDFLRLIFGVCAASGQEGQNREADIPPALFDEAATLAFKVFLQKLLSRLEHLGERIAIWEDELKTSGSPALSQLSGLRWWLSRKIDQTLTPWLQLLQTANRDSVFADWAELVVGGHGLYDVGLKRHWVNPLSAFREHLKSHVQSVIMTSATLSTSDLEAFGEEASSSELTRYTSTFDYAVQARVIIVTDVDWAQNAHLADAFLKLIRASGGGALGLFTAIARLKSVHSLVASNLAKAEIPVFAQHVDALDNGTLVELFRDDENSCLFGTDAMRQGIDVPGRSLRLVICDKLPRPVPTVLLRERCKKFGNGYRHELSRKSLEQAFGRLIRSRQDQGVFVLLDPRINTQEIQAFPANVTVERLPLLEACQRITGFLGTAANNQVVQKTTHFESDQHGNRCPNRA